MSEIAQYQNQGGTVSPFAQQGMDVAPGIGHNSAVTSLHGWAQELDAAYQLAQMVCQTAFAPQHFRGKPEEAATAMLYGHTIGLPPMVAIKSIYVVHGTPALYAKTMYAIALAAGHQIERVHATEQGVMFRCRRKGAQGWQEVEWTIDRARKAGYTSNKQYQTNPIGMLTAKCMAEAANLVAAEALAGMASVEEVQLGDVDGMVPGGDEVEPVAEPAPKKTTVKRKAVSRAKAPEPSVPDVSVEFDPEPVEDASDTDDSESSQQDVGDNGSSSGAAPVKSSRAQWTLAGQLMTELGIEDKADKATEMRSWAESQGITRELPSMAALSSEECSRFINYLEQLVNPSGGDTEGAEDGQQSWQTTEVPE